MPSYRRNYHGEYFFFTLVTHRRMRIFDKGRWRDMLSAAIRETRKEHPWEMTAIVLLPDHLHMLWGLPPDDTDYSRRISLLKRRFTRAYLAAGGREAPVTQGQKHKRYRGVWQRKFWEHTIRNAKDLRMHVDYIHLNPVRHRLVTAPRDYPWSSFHRYVREGQYEGDWCGRIDLPENVDYLWME